jgi:hypothetical protein
MVKKQAVVVQRERQNVVTEVKTMRRQCEHEPRKEGG